MARSVQDPTDVERLSALLVQQVEITSEREERLTALLERLMAASTTGAAATSASTAGGTGDTAGDTAGSDGAGAPRPRLPPSTTPAPHLHASASIGLGAADGTPLADRNIVVERRDFYTRRQEAGERFEDFLGAVRECAAFCDFCSNCVDDQIRDRIVSGAADKEAVRRLSETKELTLQRAIDICSSCEDERTAGADTRGIPGSEVRRVRAAPCAGSEPSAPFPRSGRLDQRRCQRCGRAEHDDAARCRAASAICRDCGLRGHFAVMCRRAAGPQRAPGAAGGRLRGRSWGRRTPSYRRSPTAAPSASPESPPRPPAPHRVRRVIADVYGARPTQPKIMLQSVTLPEPSPPIPPPRRRRRREDAGLPVAETPPAHDRRTGLPPGGAGCDVTRDATATTAPPAGLSDQCSPPAPGAAGDVPSWDGDGDPSAATVERNEALRGANQPLGPMWKEDPAPTRVFESVTVDYFHAAGRTFLVCADRLTGWPYVAESHRAASAAQLTRELRHFFSLMGVPAVLRSEGGPQFASSTVRRFMNKWEIRHQLSPPGHLQSDGHADAVVRAVKKLVTAVCQGGSSDEELDRGLLEIRNMPRADGQSPAQMLFGDPVRTPPVHHHAFAQRWQRLADDCDARAHELQQDVRQRHGGDTRPLSRLAIGRRVDVQDVSGRWYRTGVVVAVGARRSYSVKTPSGRLLWRDRRLLRPHRALISETTPGPRAAEDAAARRPLARPSRGRACGSADWPECVLMM